MAVYELDGVVPEIADSAWVADSAQVIGRVTLEAQASLWFGVVALPDFVSTDKALAELIKPLHQVSAFALAALVVLHVGAALKHHWIDKDGLLQRMLPGPR